MLMELKNSQILDLTEAFIRIARLKEGGVELKKKFNYSVILNEDTLQPHYKAIIEIANPSSEYLEYENKRNEIITSYAKIDSDGNIVTNGGKFVVFKDEESTESAQKEVDELNEENAELIEGRNQEILEYNEILEKVVKVNIETVTLDEVPDSIGDDIFLLRLLKDMID